MSKCKGSDALYPNNRKKTPRTAAGRPTKRFYDDFFADIRILRMSWMSRRIAMTICIAYSTR